MANFEIRANIKFLTIIGNLLRSLKLYSRFMVCPHHVEQSFMIGLNASRREGSNLKMSQERGDPPTQKIQKTSRFVQNLVEEDRRVTIDKIANAVEILHGSAFSILTEYFRLSKLSARWVPKALQENQLNQRVDLSLAILTKMEANETIFFKRCLTGDKTWIY